MQQNANKYQQEIRIKEFCPCVHYSVEEFLFVPLYRIDPQSLSCGTPETLSRAMLAHGGNWGVTITPVLSSLRRFLLLLSQGVSPVCLSCSQRIAFLSCALILGSSSQFLMGLVSVGASPLPLPLPVPLPPLLVFLSLCHMVACSYRPWHWTI